MTTNFDLPTVLVDFSNAEKTPSEKGSRRRTSVLGEYDFTLTFALSQPDADPGDLVEQLYADGCNDALISIGQHGRIALNFAREAASAEEAVLSALSDVQRIVPGTRLIEASPDFVGLTDIADILGFSRQFMRKLLLKNGPEFPLPVHDGKPAIWHIATVLAWFTKHKEREIDEALLEVSRVNMQCNLAKERNAMDRRFASRVKGLLV